jgi:hypothetical protein
MGEGRRSSKEGPRAERGRGRRGGGVSYTPTSLEGVHGHQGQKRIPPRPHLVVGPRFKTLDPPPRAVQEGSRAARLNRPAKRLPSGPRRGCLAVAAVVRPHGPRGCARSCSARGVVCVRWRACCVGGKGWWWPDAPKNAGCIMRRHSNANSRAEPPPRAAPRRSCAARVECIVSACLRLVCIARSTIHYRLAVKPARRATRL